MMNNIKCLDYESEATEDWVCSGMISFKMPVVGRKKNPQKSISLSVFVFPTVNVFLEGDRAGSWWKPFIFLDEAGSTLAMARTMFAGGPTTPHWMWFWGAPQQNQCNGPRIPSDGTECNHVSGPFTVYHLVFTPYSPFLTVTRLRSFSPHEGGRFTIDPLTNKSLFSRP